MQTFLSFDRFRKTQTQPPDAKDETFWSEERPGLGHFLKRWSKRKAAPITYNAAIPATNVNQGAASVFQHFQHVLYLRGGGRDEGQAHLPQGRGDEGGGHGIEGQQGAPHSGRGQQPPAAAAGAGPALLRRDLLGQGRGHPARDTRGACSLTRDKAVSCSGELGR